MRTAVPWTDSTEKRLQNCGALITHARKMGVPIAFTRTSYALIPSAGWLDGFEPRRSDHVFELAGPSCYSNPLLEDVIACAECFAIAGFSLERTILATMIEASFRGHRPLFVEDASIIEQGAQDDNRLQQLASQMSGIFALPVNTGTWLASTRTLKREHHG